MQQQNVVSLFGIAVSCFAESVSSSSNDSPLARHGPVPVPASSGAPVPREHGAWGLLLQPFVAGALLAKFWDPLLLPALGLVLLGFLLKEPLIVLGRQRWVWRSPNPQTPAARKWFMAELAGIAICLAILARAAPLVPLAILAAVAVVLTLVAVWATIRNLQRSVALQLVSAAGLSSCALLVALLATGHIPLWAWLLWGIQSIHAAASILVVHARLKLRFAHKNVLSGHPRRGAFVMQGIQATVALAAMGSSYPWLAAPLLLSSAVNTLELLRLASPKVLTEPLKRVGYRALTLSIVHTVAVIFVLWPLPRG